MTFGEFKERINRMEIPDPDQAQLFWYLGDGKFKVVAEHPIFITSDVLFTVDVSAALGGGGPVLG